MLLEWKEEFNLGVELFDNYHGKLVQLLNGAHEKLVQNPGNPGIDSAIDEIIEYANQHFCAEERYMEEHSYAGYVDHLDLHRSFLAQAELMQKDLRGAWHDLPMEKLLFLKAWLLHDIMVTDLDYTRKFSATQLKQCA